MVAGLSHDYVNIYGGHYSIGYATVMQVKIFSNTMVVFIS